MVEVRQIETDKLSHFHTRHRVLHYGEFTTVEEYIAYRAWAKERGVAVFILGNGSNTLFRRRTIKTLVLKNNLTGWMRPLDDNRVEASSSLNVSVILKHCQKHGLESFYYLASVPATVGGAIAMNAGRGRAFKKSIFDFVESVTYVDGDTVRTRSKSEIPHDYRWTMFTGVQDRLIASAIFRFPACGSDTDHIMQRVEYSKEMQDLSGPNCGSVFKSHRPRILRMLRGFRIGRALYSEKTLNWIINRSSNPWSIHALILVAKVAHRMVGKKAEVELIEVQ